MARTTKGRLHTRGKKNNYYLQYYVNGRQNRIALRDDNGENITNKIKAKAAAQKILMPILAGNDADRWRRVQNELTNAEDKAEEATADIANGKAKIINGWDLFLECPSRPRTFKRPLNVNTKYQQRKKIFKSQYSKFAAWIKKDSPKIKLLSEVTPELAQKYMAHLREEIAATTHNNYLSFFKNFFNCLMKDEKIFIKKNPFARIERLEGRVHSRRELTINELQTIFNNSTGEMQLLFFIGFYTGLRLGDCCTLLWSEVNLDQHIIIRAPRKTARTSHKVVKIGINPFLWNALNKTPESQRKGYVLPEYADIYINDYPSLITEKIQSFFVSCGIQIYKEGTGKKFHTEGKKRVYDCKQRAVLEVGFHSLRHTYVSLQAMHGTPAAVIQDLVGHSNPAMTEHYTHVSTAAAIAAADALTIPQLTGNADIIDLTPEDSQRKDLHKLIDTLPIDKIKKIMEVIKND